MGKDWIIKRIGTIGSRFSHLQYWVGYTVAEGERIQMLACNDEAQADALIKRYRDTGKMKNPTPHIPLHDGYEEGKDDIEPVMMTKMHTRVLYYRVPVKA